MIASLPMYDMPWLHAINDRLWHLIRTELGHGPKALSRDVDLWALWEAPDLLLAQCCGLPFRLRLMDRVSLVAAPVFDLPDCPPGQYFSWFIRRQGDARQLDTLVQGLQAVNQPHSLSGWGAAVTSLAQRGLTPGAVIETGAHLASIEAVLSGQADFAAVDAVSYQIWARQNAEDAELIDCFARTHLSPATPFVTFDTALVPALQHAMRSAIAQLSSQDRTALCLRGIEDMPLAAYADLPLPPPCQAPAIAG